MSPVEKANRVYFLMRIAFSAQMEGDFFKERFYSEDGVKNIEHPERIEKQQQDNDQVGKSLYRQQPFNQGPMTGVKPCVDCFDDNGKESPKNQNKKNLKKQDIEMPGHPFGEAVIPVADLRHKIVK